MWRPAVQNFRIGKRVALALALPVLGITILSVWVLSGYYRAANDMRDLRRIAELAPKVGDLVHVLQKERGVSAGFAGMRGDVLADRLPARYAETNAMRDALATTLTYFETARYGRNLAARIAAARETVDQIDGWRSAIAEGRMRAPELTRHYGNAVIRLTGIVEEILVVGKEADLTRSIYAYLQLL